MISIKLNSKNKEIEKNTSISKLIILLNLKSNGIVMEVNLNIIKKEKFDKYLLKNGDVVEIITFMGGG